MEGVLTANPIPVTAARMGRPSLKVRATVVRLAEGTPERIEALVGPNKMSEFIREAVERELQRLEAEARKKR